jgi:plastocyanin
MLNTRRRFLLGPLAIALLAFPGGLIAGRAGNVFAGQHVVQSANNAMPAISAMSGMNMASAAAAAKTAPVLMLHRKVIHVTIDNFKFTPTNVVVSPDTRIIWTNHDSDPHTVDSVKKGWTSSAVDPGNTFARVFKTTGSFAYFCSIHPFMHGSVIVRK